MEPSHPKSPTVIPLTRNLIEEIMKNQLSAPLQVAAGQAQRSAAQAQKSTLHSLAAGQPRGRAQTGASQQTATVLSQQSRVTAVNLTGLGDHHQGSESPRTSVTVQVLNNNEKPMSKVVSKAQPIRYTYKVKIISPNKRSVTIVRYLHNMTSKFESVNGLRVELMDEFGEHVPSTATFDVGYYEGKQQSKIWLVTPEDFERLYELHPKGGEILLWCDGASVGGTAEGRGSTKRNKEAESAVSKRSQQEAEVESTFKELKERHQDSWDTPRLKLWARCIVSGVHDDYDNPPESPAFSSSPPKRVRKESLSDAIGGAAIAIVKALKTDPKEKACTSQSGTTFCPGAGPGVSPGRAVDLRMKITNN